MPIQRGGIVPSRILPDGALFPGGGARDIERHGSAMGQAAALAGRQQQRRANLLAGPCDRDAPCQFGALGIVALQQQRALSQQQLALDQSQQRGQVGGRGGQQVRRDGEQPQAHRWQAAAAMERLPAESSPHNCTSGSVAGCARCQAAAIRWASAPCDGTISSERIHRHMMPASRSSGDSSPVR